MPSDLIPWIVSHAGVAALAFARAAGLAWAGPGLSTPGLGVRIRLLLALLLGVMIAPAVAGGAETVVSGGSWWNLVAAILGEAVVGACLGWSAALVVAGARQAGEIVGIQAGFAPAALFDSDAGDEMTALGHLYGLVALGIFLALDGPVVLVRALVESCRLVPLGSALAALSENTAALAFGRVGQALALALRAAAPAAVALALAGVALGLLGRAAPSLQILALAVPVRAGLGLVLVLLGLAALVAALSAAWTSWPGGMGP
jgi:flagellar biosynthesis protein FliR